MNRPIRLYNLRNFEYFTLLDKPFDVCQRCYKLSGENLVACRSRSGFFTLSPDTLVFRYRDDSELLK